MFPKENCDHYRVLSFKRVSNFRDLGGYKAACGAQVKWGVLYRSGHLGKMRSADLKRFEALHIHTLIDFRSEQEKEREPNRLPVSSFIKTLSLPIPNPFDASWAKELKAAIKSKNFQGIDPSREMRDYYQGFAVENIEQYKGYIHAVLAAQGNPVLWHCTAGKDRTGFAAAILLRLLGVPHDTVIKDYLFSVKYVDRRKPLILILRLTRGKQFADAVQSLMLVQKEWIQAAFQSIDEGWGSFERYSHEALELTKTQINQLRHLLLKKTVNQ